MNPIINNQIHILPKEIKSVITQPEREKKVQDLLETNPELLSSYNIWSRSNRHMIKINSILNSIDEIATKITIKKYVKFDFLSGVLASIAQTIYRISLHIFEFITMRKDDFVDESIQLYTSGLITARRCINQIAIDAGFDDGGIKKIASYLFKMSYAEAKALYSELSYTYLYSVVLETLPYLSTLTSQQIKDILLLRKNILSYTLLHECEFARNVSSLFEKLEIKEMIELLTVKDKEDNTPFHIFFKKDNLTQQNKTLEIILSRIVLLEDSDLEKILGAKNNLGLTPLHLALDGNLEEQFNFYDTCSSALLKKLISFHDNKGNQILGLVKYLLKCGYTHLDLSPEEFVKILSNTNIFDVSWLHDMNNLKSAIPYLITLPPSLARQVFTPGVLQKGIENEVLTNYCLSKVFEFDHFNKFDFTDFGNEINIIKLKAWLTSILPVGFFNKSKGKLGQWMNKPHENPKIFNALFVPLLLGMLPITAEILNSLSERDRNYFLQMLLREPELVKNVFLSKTINFLIVAEGGYDPKTLNTFMPMLKELSSKDIQEIFCDSLEDIFTYSQKLIFFNQILLKGFGSDFSWDQKEPLKKSVKLWVIKKIQSSQFALNGISILTLPYFLGYHNFIKKHLQFFPEIFQEQFYSQMIVDPIEIVEWRTSAISFKYELRHEHMQEGIVIGLQVPPFLDLSQVQLVGQTGPLSIYPYFYSFLKPFFLAAEKEALWKNQPLLKETIVDLLTMENNIRSNFPLFQDHQSLQKYTDICAYLTHIFVAYKIGQADENIDIQDKNNVLKEIADASRNCLPRWREAVQQIYITRPGDHGNNEIVSLKDRVLAKLRAIRINHILFPMTDKIVNGGENGRFHYSNHILDAFQQELGTKMALYNDHWGHISEQEIMELRILFYSLYNIDVLIKFFKDHVNEQKERETESTDKLDIKSHEVEEWLRMDDSCKDWNADAYKNIPQQVHAMLKRKEDVQAEEYLSSMGIEWRRKEESVEDATDRLEFQILGLQGQQRSSISITRELEDLQNLEESKQPQALVNLIQRNPHISSHQNVTMAEFIIAFEEWKTKNKERISSLQEIVDQIEAKEDESKKRKILIQNNKILLAQPVEEVLQTSVIRAAQANKFINEVVYDSERKFTYKASALFLASMGVLTPVS